MTSSAALISTPEANEPHWFCVRAKPKAEHLAAAHLRQLSGEIPLEVFCPRIRYRRSTRRGPRHFCEALFPGYLFARFILQQHLRAVSYCGSVSGVLRFGEAYPIVPQGLIESLQQEMGEQEICHVPAELEEGQEIEIGEGALRGFAGLVLKVHSGNDRVRVLLEFLGREQEVEVEAWKVAGKVQPRLRFGRS